MPNDKTLREAIADIIDLTQPHTVYALYGPADAVDDIFALLRTALTETEFVSGITDRLPDDEWDTGDLQDAIADAFDAITGEQP